jgi:hypothetical protein
MKVIKGIEVRVCPEHPSQEIVAVGHAIASAMYDQMTSGFIVVDVLQEMGYLSVGDEHHQDKLIRFDLVNEGEAYAVTAYTGYTRETFAEGFTDSEVQEFVGALFEILENRRT